MKRFLLALGLLAATIVTQAQETAQETARSFMRSGDFDNAILVLTRALQTDKTNLELQKDLSQALFYKRDFAKATEMIDIMLDNPAADVAAYQIAGNVYRAMERAKEADKLYRRALHRFPKSGPLYSEFGELLWARKDFSAIQQWEKGIREDPGYSGNYYNAALYYYYTRDKVWTLVYGEIFVNMESLTERGTAMRGLLLSAYKEKLFSDADMMKDQKKAAPFEKAFLETVDKQTSLINRGLNPEVLTMLRTRFLLDWSKTYAAKFPHHLFDYQLQLLREGMFDAYNQWLFGSTQNLAAFENWCRTHPAEWEKFNTFQKGRIFRMPAGQYYGE